MTGESSCYRAHNEDLCVFELQNIFLKEWMTIICMLFCLEDENFRQKNCPCDVPHMTISPNPIWKLNMCDLHFSLFSDLFCLYRGFSLVEEMSVRSNTELSQVLVSRVKCPL